MKKREGKYFYVSELNIMFLVAYKVRTIMQMFIELRFQIFINSQNWWKFSELGGKADIVGQIREIVLVGKALAVQAYDFSNGFYRFNWFDVFCCSVNMILQLAQTEFCVTMTGTGFATVTLKG